MHYTLAIEYRFYEQEEYEKFISLPPGEMEDYIEERLEPFNEQHQAKGYYGTHDYYNVLAKEDTQLSAAFTPQEVINKDLKHFAFLNFKNQWIDREVFETADEDTINLFDVYISRYLNEEIAHIAQDMKRDKTDKPYRYDVILFVDCHN